jgi:hypothetical protein
MVFNATFKNILAVSSCLVFHHDTCLDLLLTMAVYTLLQAKDVLTCLVFRHNKCLDLLLAIAVYTLLQEKDALPCLVFRHGKCLDFSYHIAVKSISNCILAVIEFFYIL